MTPQSDEGVEGGLKVVKSKGKEGGSWAGENAGVALAATTVGAIYLKASALHRDEEQDWHLQDLLDVRKTFNIFFSQF